MESDQYLNARSQIESMGRIEIVLIKQFTPFGGAVDSTSGKFKIHE
jgi:hypothetical protein